MGFAIARPKGVDARLRGLWTGVNALKGSTHPTPYPRAVGWVERSETHQFARGRRDDGFRCAQPILRLTLEP